MPLGPITMEREAFLSILVGRANMIPLYHGLRNAVWQRGAALISVGLLVIVAALFWPAAPVVAAIALIGRGAVLTLQSSPRTPRQDSLVVVNLAVYSTLVGLAIVAQSNAVLHMSTKPVSLAMLLDHAAAIVILAGLLYRVFSQLSQPST